MKRYVLFAGERHYANGGWFDFRGSFDDLAAAIEAGEVYCARNEWPYRDEWYHVLDTQTCKMAASDDEGDHEALGLQSRTWPGPDGVAERNDG